MLEHLNSPTEWLRRHGKAGTLKEVLTAYEQWWHSEGIALSTSVDRAGTPRVRQFDPFGNRVDEILMPAGYDRLVKKGYELGAVWRAFEGDALPDTFALGYLTSFFDPGLYCPHTVSLSTAVPLAKYGERDIRERYLPQLLRKDDSVWQGATWMTEARGGSDLGATVETSAVPHASSWHLTGDKYFCSNAGAELAVVVARPEGAPEGIRGLNLFLLPRYRMDGSLNYHIRRLKDKIGTRSVPTGEVELYESEAYLLGQHETGVYLILEVLNISRVANSIGSVALMQRALAEAYTFASRRKAFGKPLIEHPLMQQQFEQHARNLEAAFALAWTTVDLLHQVRDERPPYSQPYSLFRLLTHLAKYWTAEQAVQAAKWAMEVWAGQGTLEEFGVERLLREAMILAIWEGGRNRHLLDALEVMTRRQAHEQLWAFLEHTAEHGELTAVQENVHQWLCSNESEREANAEEVLNALASFTGRTLAEM
jgi:alkylation response protein AidB-like acyl-CoA dehydrogenase